MDALGMLLRRLRGIAGTALLWAVPWAILLALGVTTTVLILGVRVAALRAFTQGLLTGFGWGLAAGALFGSALMLTEQKRGIAGLTRWRGALWGALAGIWFPALITAAFGPSVVPWLAGAWPAWLGAAGMGAVSGLVTIWIVERGSQTLSQSPDSPALDGRPFDQVTGGSPLDSNLWPNRKTTHRE